MSSGIDLDIEKRKARILDRLAEKIAREEIEAEENAKRAEEAKIAYEAEQEKIFSEIKSILPAIMEIECEKFPAFMLKVGEICTALSLEYDQLKAESEKLDVDFRSARNRYNNEKDVSNLFNEVGKAWHTEDLPEDLMMLLNFSFGNLDVQKFLSLGLLRFMDFRHRGALGMSQLNAKLKVRRLKMRRKKDRPVKDILVEIRELSLSTEDRAKLEKLIAEIELTVDTCVDCNQSFIIMKRGQRYCSNNCASRVRQRVKRRKAKYSLMATMV